MVMLAEFFGRLRCLRARRVDRDPAKEPVAPVVAIEDSHEPECGEEELVAVKDTSVIAECLPRIPVETIDDSLVSIPDPPEVEQQHVETTAPLVTEDIYDPLIMNLSPRIGSRWGSTDDDKSRHASLNTNGLATDTSTGTAAAGETLDQNFFLYGVTLLRDRKKKVGASIRVYRCGADVCWCIGYNTGRTSLY